MTSMYECMLIYLSRARPSHKKPAITCVEVVRNCKVGVLETLIFFNKM